MYIDPNTMMWADNYVDSKSSVLEAAYIIADVWSVHKTGSISIDSYSIWFGQEFINKFLDRCAKNSCLAEAIDITWYPTNNYSLIKKWIGEYINKSYVDTMFGAI